MADVQSLINQLRAQQFQQQLQQQNMIPPGGGTISPDRSRFSGMDMGPSTNQQRSNPGSSILDGLRMYNKASDGGLNRLLGMGGAGGAAGAGGFSAAGAAPAIQQGVAGTIGGMAPMGGAALPSAASMGFGAGAGGAGAASGAGGAASGLGGGMAAAGPWAALAAAILGNETYARKKGYRSEDPKKYAQHLATGKVLEQDVEKRWAPKVDKMTGNIGLGGDMRGAANLMTGDFKGAWKGFKDGTLGKLFKIF